MTRHTKFMNQARKTMRLSVVQDAQLYNILDALCAEYEAEIRLLKAKQPKPQTAEQ